ncbi:MAG: hypothetical protein ACI4WH_05615 [Oscillospiraceae bacterium]
MKNLKKYLPCVLINVFMVFMFILLGILSFIKSYIISGDAFFDTLETKDIYSSIYNSLDTYYQEQYNSTGIPKEVYLNAIDLDEIETITDDLTYHGVNYIGGNPNSLTITYNFDKLENSINTFFDEYAKSINYAKDDVYYSKVSTVTQNAIDKVTSQCDVFNWNTLKSVGLLDKLASYLPYVDYVQVAVIVILVILLIFLIALNGKHYFLDNVYWIGTSLSISSIMMLIPCTYLKRVDYFSSFSVKSEIVFNSVTGFLNTTLDKFISMWFVMLGVGVVVFVVGFILNLCIKKHQ